jgi:hypothetical protein
MAVYLALLSEQLIEVLTSILSNTIINCIFYMMCEGWNITRFTLDRNVVTNTVIVGASLYLIMLAKDYSAN